MNQECKSCMGSNSWRGDLVVVVEEEGLGVDVAAAFSTDDAVGEPSATLSKVKSCELSPMNCGLYSFTLLLPAVITTISPLPFISLASDELEEDEEYFPKGLLEAFLFLRA